MQLTKILATVSLFFLILSCQREVSLENRNNLTGNFTANIGGADWASDGSASRLMGSIIISGTSSNGKRIVISLLDSGVRRYTLNSQTFNILMYKDSSGREFNTFDSDSSNLAGGYVNVTSIDTAARKISGNFSVRVYDDSLNMSVNITNGQFANISYAATAPTIPINGTDTFRFTHNGTNWSATQIVDSLLPAPMDMIMIQGWNTSSNVIGQLVVEKNIAPGIYPFASGSVFSGNILQYFPNGLASLPYLTDHGTLQILEHNTSTRRIRGNFNCTLWNDPVSPTDSVKITNGYFSCRYN